MNDRDFFLEIERITDKSPFDKTLAMSVLLAERGITPPVKHFLVEDIRNLGATSEQLCAYILGHKEYLDRYSTISSVMDDDYYSEGDDDTE